MKREVVIACDFSSKESLLTFLDKLGDNRPYLKIGMELYYATGADLVRELKARGFKIFLDLKLHDIPNTVYKAMSVLADLDVDMINVHAAGSIEMMKAAKRALTEKGKNTILLAVTQLTSTSQEVMEKDLWIEKDILETVKHYAQNAKEAGCDGVVCSPLEVQGVAEACGKDFVTVTPGIRFATDAKGDQKRVTTPAKAHELGSHYIVVGRSITASEDPKAAYERCVAEFERGE